MDAQHHLRFPVPRHLYFNRLLYFFFFFFFTPIVIKVYTRKLQNLIVVLHSSMIAQNLQLTAILCVMFDLAVEQLLADLGNNNHLCHPSLWDCRWQRAGSMTFRDSRDNKIQKAWVKSRPGQKWVAFTALPQAKGKSEAQRVRGSWRRITVKMTREEQWKVRAVRAVERRYQGAWTRWSVKNRKLTWADLWRLEPFQISFLLMIKR